VTRMGRGGNQGRAFEVLTGLELGALAGSPPMGAVIPARIARHRDDGLTELAFDGGVLLVPRLAGAVGAALRVRVRAEEIMLALEEPRTISANNVLLARVAAVNRDGAT